MLFIVNLRSEKANKLAELLKDKLKFNVEVEANTDDKYINNDFKNIMVFDDTDYKVDLTIFVNQNSIGGELSNYLDLILYYYV